MAYEFDKALNRKHTNAIKWDDMGLYYKGTDLLPMWIADMDFEAAPEIQEAMKARVEHGVYGYVSTPASYFQRAAEWTKRRHGHEVAAETLVHCPGVVPGLSLLIQLFTERGEKVIIQPPVYPPFRNVLVKNHRQPVLNPLIEENGRYRMDYGHLESLASDPEIRWLILCNPHNPVGRSWSREELQKLADICLKHGVRIISDEIWRDLVYAPNRHTPLASLGAAVEEMTVTLWAVSKTFNLAGLQASFISFPRENDRKRFREEMERMDIVLHNTLGLTGTQAAMEHGEPWLEELKDYLADNIAYAKAYMETNIPEVTFFIPEATYLLWLDFRALGLRGKELGELLEGTGRIALNAGASFGDEGKGFMRMNVACPRHQLEEALRRIEAAVKSVRGEK